MVALVDTNVLVYRHDPREPQKQETATGILRRGIADGSIRIAHQAVIEFYAAVTRPLKGFGPLLTVAEATRETEEILMQFPILYPEAALIHAALRATAAYQLSWFDALMWAYAETNGIRELLSEDFQDDRFYGSVRVVNPFRT